MTSNTEVVHCHIGSVDGTDRSQSCPKGSCIGQDREFGDNEMIKQGRGGPE
eukprot:CAMPEP_0203638998 /NCGR_PEP_ID=MMETSP0088-20131115/4861_1 /ASSEMBLY_ACC=CAM_ASM_001087 /TAXON_ID=426623 /ORGANISM="Chaetoceros affinis, Strain CCMP159" /LENGTH=50 /DNA_ID=CAMNT_0050493761 /DNA_START=283 /DNA_END=432 /DNA_ORIENTATION=-